MIGKVAPMIEYDLQLFGGRGASSGGGKTYHLYHGSPNASIDSFDIEKAGTNTSTGEKFLFFTDSKEMADDFSYERIPSTRSMFLDVKGKQGKIYDVDVTMKHPLDFTNLTKKDMANIKKMQYDYSNLTDDRIKMLSENNNQLFKVEIDISRITEFGYDGFIAKMNRKGDKEYAVVNNKQVKIRKR